MYINYAHRGASAYAPENTLISFEKGLELGANGIELDLQKTKDGKIVIFHDDIIDNKSNGKGKISDYTYDELLKLDFGKWFDERYTGERIMLFEDFCEKFLNKNITFAIELKAKEIEKQTLDIINKYKAHDNIYISSFHFEFLENVRKIDKYIKLSWLILEEITKENIARLLNINGNQICPKAEYVTQSQIELAKEAGLGVRLWGVKNEEIMEKVYKLDTEGMTVNFPDKLNDLLCKKELIKKVSFFNYNTEIKQDFRGHSSALKYICKQDNQQYYIKIYPNNRVNDLLYIDGIYKKLKIPTANIIESGYLEDTDKTYVIYEYINGKTLFELTKELNINEIEKIGRRTGSYLSRFRTIKCNSDNIKKLYELEFNKLIENLYYMKNKYEQSQNKKLAPINLDRLCKNFLKYKEYIYKVKPSFIHGDINLKNVIVRDSEIYFIDNSDGKFSFRSLDFRGNCWYGWDGDNKEREQAMYRGIYKGLFGGNIPDEFNIELAFTIIYEFLLKVYEPNKTGNIEKLESSFNKFNDIFIRTNYFENHKFEWFDLEE